MYECGYMYFRFDHRHLEFLSDIGVCYHWQSPPWDPPTKNLTYNVILFSHITHMRINCFLRATILLILDECRQSKLLIWRQAYWGHAMLRSWNRCCPVDNLFVRSHKKCLSYLFRQKNYAAKSIPPICNTKVNHLRSRQNQHSFSALFHGVMYQLPG